MEAYIWRLHLKMREGWQEQEAARRAARARKANPLAQMDECDSLANKYRVELSTLSNSVKYAHNGTDRKIICNKIKQLRIKTHPDKNRDCSE